MAETDSTNDHTAADAVVATLQSHGVDTIFALPGEENLPVVSAIRRAGLELVVCRHEQHAGFMAVASARLRGGIGVCLATLGPGALNTFTPLAQAQLMAVPFLVITGQKPIRDNEEGPFQVVDVVGAAGPITTWASSVADPDLAAVEISNAIRAASDGGAAVVELPEDVAAAHVPSVPVDPSPAPRCVAGAGELDRAVARIDAASRPLVMVGIGAASEEASAGLEQLVERTHLSVLATQMGKGALDEQHRRSIGSLGMHRPDYSHLALEHSDLVIAVGYQPVEHPPRSWNRRPTPVVHIHRTKAHLVEGYRPILEVVGDIPETLGQLARRLAPVDPTWADHVRAAVRSCLLREHQHPAGTQRSDRLSTPLDVVAAVEAASSPDTVVALDNGVYKLWFGRHFRARRPNALLLDNATASMGAGLAGAMEAARLGRPSIAVVGDGGLLMNIGDLETASRLGLTLTVVVVRDDAFGFIAWHQQEQDRVRHGVDLTNPDMIGLARAFGAHGATVGSDGTLGELLTEAETRTGVSLIDCPVDYSMNEQLEDGETLLAMARADSAS